MVLDLWDQLVDAICRPPRDDYTIDDLIGGRRGSFRIHNREYVRQDLTITNKKGLKLQCSHFKPKEAAEAGKALPCVVYCHCNSGSRRDAEEAVYLLLPHNITVFCLDFAGSGLSEGNYVTLGAHEVDDLECAVNHLRTEGRATTVGLWGRSMGAVTALLYSQRDPSIAGVVLDSPFSRLTDLMLELVAEQKLPIPRVFLKTALSMMKRSVRKRAGFAIDSVAPLEIVPQSFIPALFGHADGDTFVAKHHSERLAAAYGGDKNLITFEGDHNSIRPQFFYSSALIFLHNVLQCADVLDVPAASRRSTREGSADGQALSRTTSPPWDRARMATWNGSPEQLRDLLSAADEVGGVVADTRASEEGVGAGGRRAVMASSRPPPAERDPASLRQVTEDADAFAVTLADEDAELARALELSLLEQAATRQPQQQAEGSALPVSTAAATVSSAAGQPGGEPALPALPSHLQAVVPSSVLGLDSRSAEEAMLAQAIAASLRDAAASLRDAEQALLPAVGPAPASLRDAATTTPAGTAAAGQPGVPMLAGAADVARAQAAGRTAAAHQGQERAAALQSVGRPPGPAEVTGSMAVMHAAAAGMRAADSSSSASGGVGPSPSSTGAAEVVVDRGQRGSPVGAARSRPGATPMKLIAKAPAATLHLQPQASPATQGSQGQEHSLPSHLSSSVASSGQAAYPAPPQQHVGGAAAAEQLSAEAQLERLRLQAAQVVFGSPGGFQQ